ncbi:hypothetical protein [Novosphingobium sp. 32-60-15]|uniref:hypothetical protein n=1 Tax=Novosphingobium sp. 32-60-15 TaxID=1970410 RepID=UPI0025CCA43C|nr:hypothetical protein [Novosphingobium sp. 32-60-15]
MRLKVFVVGIDLPAFSVLDPQRLDRSNDYTAISLDVMRGNLLEITNVENADPACESIVQHLAIGMARVFQRFHCQSASKRDPLSACKREPPGGVALG